MDHDKGMHDLELVDCAKATARVYAPRVEWDEYVADMAQHLAQELIG